MKKFFLIILIGTIISVFNFSSSYGLEDTIVAIVNKEIVTLKDLREFLAAKHMQLKGEGKSQDEIIEVMQENMSIGLNRLIEERLLVNEADKKEFIIREEFVEKRLSEIRQEFPTEDVFVTSLSKDGITVTDLKNKIRDQIKAQSIIDHEVRLKIFVNPPEVTEYYEKNPSAFMAPERVNVDSIFIQSEADEAATNQKLTEAREALKQKIFDEVARQYSSRPSVGIVARGQFKSEIEDIIFKLNIGEVSVPVVIDNGYYIFKVTGRSPAENVPLENVKQEIRNLIFQEKFRNRLQEYLAKLKKDAFIEIKQ